MLKLIRLLKLIGIFDVQGGPKTGRFLTVHNSCIMTQANKLTISRSELLDGKFFPSSTAIRKKISDK